MDNTYEREQVARDSILDIVPDDDFDFSGDD